jgi:hypothetical protein
MKKITQAAVFGFLALLAFAALGNAHADPVTRETMNDFFNNIQGHYTGNGVAHQLTAQGSSEVDYTIDLQIGENPDSDTTGIIFDSQVDAEGKLSHENAELRLSGGHLFYIPYASASIPLKVLENTGNSLSYSLSLVGEGGQVYDIKVDYTLKDDTLDSRTITSTNGVAVSDDQFNISRF